MQFNDLYCLSRDAVHTLSCGAARPTDFDEHVAALQYYDDPLAVVGPIETRLREALVQTHGRDWCEGWWKGLPEYRDVPGQINVIEILRLWTYAKALELLDWGRMRYNLLGGEGGHWFPGNKATQFNEKKLRLALEDSPFADAIPAHLREAHRMLNDKPVKRLSRS